MPCMYRFSKITVTENPVSVLWWGLRQHRKKAHHFVSATPRTLWHVLPVCAGQHKAKCCAHVLSVPGAIVAFASAGKGYRGCHIHLISPAIVGLNFQAKETRELYFLLWVLPILIVLERSSRMYLHMLLWISTNSVCIDFCFAVIPTGYLEAFLCITVLRHFHSVLKSPCFHMFQNFPDYSVHSGCRFYTGLLLS